MDPVPNTPQAPSPEETISLFEGILQSSPDDQMALEALAAAYQQAGNELRARSTLLRLANVILVRRDAAGAANAIEMLRPLAQSDFDALESMTALEALVKGQAVPGSAPGAQAPGFKFRRGAAAAASAAPASGPPSGIALNKQILKREMQLAWDLLEATEINQDEYSQLLDDVTQQINGANNNRTISLLHSIVDRNIPGFDHIMEFIKKHGNCPYISLASFDTQKCDLHGVPPNYLIRQGALPFDSIDGELLVAILNPTDTTLQEDLRKYLGVPCHFYFVSPEEYDLALVKTNLSGS